MIRRYRFDRLVRAVREEMNLNRVALAKRIGTAQGTISKVENRQLDLDPEALMRLYQLIGAKGSNELVTKASDFIWSGEWRESEVKGAV